MKLNTITLYQVQITLTTFLRSWLQR